MKTSKQLKEDMRAIRASIKPLKELGVDTSAQEEILLKLEKELQTKKYEEYIKTVKMNFTRGDFRVSKDKIKMILLDEELKQLVENRYKTEAKIAMDKFDCYINLKPSHDDLKLFLLRS